MFGLARDGCEAQGGATLGDLHGTITREGLASPSVIVVGDVVRGVAAAALPIAAPALAARRG